MPHDSCRPGLYNGMHPFSILARSFIVQTFVVAFGVIFLIFQFQVDHDDTDNLALLRFNALWEACYRHDSLLVFSTGRSLISYKKLRKEKPLLTPDITVLSVGTQIMYGESMIPDDDWEQLLNKNWNRNIVTEETAKYPELRLQVQYNSQ